MTGMDPIDLRLLDEFQRDLPLGQKPFEAIGAALDLDEAEVINRLAMLQADGAVSRIGATVRPNVAGASTLAAMAVPCARIEDVAAIVGAAPGVNHSYLREDDWNLWFVAAAADEPTLAALLEQISGRCGLRVLDLRLVRPFNIDLGFSLRGRARPMTADRATATMVPDAADRALLNALSRHGLPLVPRPYAALARPLGHSETELIAKIQRLLDAGIITRLGVIVRHRSLGWTANAMVVWDLPPDHIQNAGRALAVLPGVTLCYQRQTVPEVWPYPLYSMIHARSRPEALAVLERARALPELAGAASKPLFSTRCFKQTGALIGVAA